MTVSTDSPPWAINNKVWLLNTNYFFQAGNDLIFIFFFSTFDTIGSEFFKNDMETPLSCPC